MSPVGFDHWTTCSDSPRVYQLINLFYTNGICILQGLPVDLFFSPTDSSDFKHNSLTNIKPPVAEGWCLCPTNAQSFCWERFQVQNDWMGRFFLIPRCSLVRECLPTFIIHFWKPNLVVYLFASFGTLYREYIHCVVVSNISYFHRDPWEDDPIWLVFFKSVEAAN